MTVLILAGLLSMGGGIAYLAYTVTGFHRVGSAQLTISFLGYTNTAECLIARFAVTNCGFGTAVAYKIARIERRGVGFETVVATPTLHLLTPSTGDILEVKCCDGYISKPWRLTCHYAPRSLQTDAFDWQNRPKGLGRLVVPYLPIASGSVACTVNATTEWIEK